MPTQFTKGLYRCVIDDQSLTESKAGNPQFRIRTKVLAKLNQDGTETAFDDETFRTIWLTLTDKTVDWVARDMGQLGFHGKPSQIDLESPNCISLIGTVAEFFCSVDDDGGERWRVSTPRSPASPVAKPSEEATLRVDARFGDAFTTKVADAPKASVTDADDSSTPF